MIINKVIFAEDALLKSHASLDRQQTGKFW